MVVFNQVEIAEIGDTVIVFKANKPVRCIVTGVRVEDHDVKYKLDGSQRYTDASNVFFSEEDAAARLREVELARMEERLANKMAALNEEEE